MRLIDHLWNLHCGITEFHFDFIKYELFFLQTVNLRMLKIRKNYTTFPFRLSTCTLLPTSFSNRRRVRSFHLSPMYKVVCSSSSSKHLEVCRVRLWNLCLRSNTLERQFENHRLLYRPKNVIHSVKSKNVTSL